MSIYGTDSKLVHLSDTAQQVITGAIVIGVFVCMAYERPPDIVFLISLIIIMLTEILTLKEVLAGFSNESLITIGSLFLVVGAVQKSHVMEYLARKAFGIRSSNNVGTIRMLSSLAGLSAFFNNIPLCNLMIPIVRDWARARSIPLSYLMMPLSYAVIAGGLTTMIGTSTSLIVQGLMQDDIGYSFPFFTPAAIAVPGAVIFITYMVFCAPYLLPARSGLIRAVRDKAADFIAEVEVLEGSVFIKHDVLTMMGRLGLQQDSVIKIRRRLQAGEASDSDGSPPAPPAHFSSPVSVKDVGSAEAELEMVQVSLRNRIRAESDTFATAGAAPRTHTDASTTATTTALRGGDAKETSGARSISASSHGSGSGGRGIADSEYVQQHRGAWGSMNGAGGSASAAAADDITVNGYRQVRLTARDIESGSDGFFHRQQQGEDHEVEVEEEERTGLTDDFSAPRYRDIINPAEFDVIRAGDIVFIASAAEVVTKVLKAVGSERAGLKLLDSSVLDLPVSLLDFKMLCCVLLRDSSCSFLVMLFRFIPPYYLQRFLIFLCFRALGLS
jgi:di/tricarboxylate transporter